MLAGTGAEIDLRPQLEILTDEVRASHGATTGALDENMRFYLLSRGLDPDTARALLEWAFLEDAVRAHSSMPELRQRGGAGSWPQRWAADVARRGTAVTALRGVAMVCIGYDRGRLRRQFPILVAAGQWASPWPTWTTAPPRSARRR